MTFLQPTSLSPLAELYFRTRPGEQSGDALERFLARYPDLNAVHLIDVLMVDQAWEWRHGTGPSVESYLRRFPALEGERQLVLELVYGEMRAARALDMPVDVGTYVVRFPHLAQALRRQLEVSSWLAGADGDGGAQDSP